MLWKIMDPNGAFYQKLIIASWLIITAKEPFALFAFCLITAKKQQSDGTDFQLS